MVRYLSIVSADFKLVYRDSTLRAFLVLPALIYVVVLFAYPWLMSTYEEVEPYRSLLVIVAVIQLVQMFGFMYSMVLVDSKETKVSQVYGVVPISKWLLVGIRLLFPTLVTFIMSFALLLIQDTIIFSLGSAVITALMVAAILPLYIMTVATFSDNRVEAMITIKAVNIVLILPIVATFVPDAYGWLFSILPNHWLFVYGKDTMASLPVVCYTVTCALTTLYVGRRFLKNQFL